MVDEGRDLIYDAPHFVVSGLSNIAHTLMTSNVYSVMMGCLFMASCAFCVVVYCV